MLNSAARPADVLGLVVVNYGSCDLLAANLVQVVDELRAAVDPARTTVLTVVVDNFTSKVERRRVVELGVHHGFDTVVLDENVGFGAGVNVGAARLLEQGASQLLLINPDATINAESVLRLVEHVDAEPLDLVGPAVYRPDGSLWSGLMDVYLRTGQLRARRHRPVDLEASGVREWISGACLVASRQLWELTSGFDEDYFMYWEDVDLGHRVALLGGRSVVIDAARAVHEESGTQHHRGKHRSPLFYHYNTRNRLLFAAKHLSRAAQREWIGQSRRNIKRMVRPEGLRALQPPWTSLRALIRGEREGRRLVRSASRI